MAKMVVKRNIEDESDEEIKPAMDISENDFWSALQKDFTISKGEKKVGTIEKEMSGGIKTVFDMWKYEITKLTRHERIAYATLKDCPLFGDIVRDLIRSKRNEKAWLAKHLYKYFETHTKAFTNVYHNKKIQKALNKITNAGGSDFH